MAKQLTRPEAISIAHRLVHEQGIHQSDVLVKEFAKHGTYISERTGKSLTGSGLYYLATRAKRQVIKRRRGGNTTVIRPVESSAGSSAPDTILAILTDPDLEDGKRIAMLKVYYQ